MAISQRHFLAAAAEAPATAISANKPTTFEFISDLDVSLTYPDKHMQANSLTEESSKEEIDFIFSNVQILNRVNIDATPLIGRGKKKITVYTF